MNILLIVILGIAVLYPLHCLYLHETDGHEGPLPSKNKFVMFGSDPNDFDTHLQRVALFDWFRRIFGVYSIEGNVWHVKEKPSGFIEAFTCPFCLSFWVSIPFTLIFVLTEHPDWLLVIPVHFAIATISVLLHGMIFD